MTRTDTRVARVCTCLSHPWTRGTAQTNLSLDMAIGLPRASSRQNDVSNTTRDDANGDRYHSITATYLRGKRANLWLAGSCRGAVVLPRRHHSRRPRRSRHDRPLGSTENRVRPGRLASRSTIGCCHEAGGQGARSLWCPGARDARKRTPFVLEAINTHP